MGGEEREWTANDRKKEKIGSKEEGRKKERIKSIRRVQKLQKALGSPIRNTLFVYYIRMRYTSICIITVLSQFQHVEIQFRSSFENADVIQPRDFLSISIRCRTH